MPRCRLSAYAVQVYCLVFVVVPALVAGGEDKETELPPIHISKRPVERREEGKVAKILTLAERLGSGSDKIQRAAVDQLNELDEKELAAFKEAIRTNVEEPWARRARQVMETIDRKAAWKSLTPEEKQVVRQRLRSAVMNSKKKASQCNYPFKHYVFCDIGDIRIAYPDQARYGNDHTGIASCGGLPIDSRRTDGPRCYHGHILPNADGPDFWRGFSFEHKDGEARCVFYGVPFLIRYRRLVIEDQSVPFGRGKTVIFLDSRGKVYKIVYAPKSLNR